MGYIVVLLSKSCILNLSTLEKLYMEEWKYGIVFFNFFTWYLMIFQSFESGAEYHKILYWESLSIPNYLKKNGPLYTCKPDFGYPIHTIAKQYLYKKVYILPTTLQHQN